MLSVQWSPDPEMFFSSFPFALIAGASFIMFTPVHATAGAAARPRLVDLRRASVERTAGQALERRPWAGIPAWSLYIVLGHWAGLLVEQDAPSARLLISTFAGGIRLGPPGRRLRPRGHRALRHLAGIDRGSGRGKSLVAGLWPIAIALVAFWVLPAVALGGALGGIFRRPAGSSPGPEL